MKLYTFARLITYLPIGAVLKDPGFERDGRRPQAWRDNLENIIGGDWVWEEGEIAGVQRGQIGVDIGAGTTQRTIYNVGKNRKASRSAVRRDPGVGLSEGVTIDDQHLWFKDEIPETRAVAHIPGALARDIPRCLSSHFEYYTSRLHYS